MHCPKRPSCFDKAGIQRRVLASSCYPAFFRGHQRVGTPEYLSMMQLRKIWAEGILRLETGTLYFKDSKIAHMEERFF